MRNSQLTLSLIIPALNEEAVVGYVLKAVYTEAEKFFSDFELIAIDDGSTDATGQVMQEFAARHPKARVVHNKPNIGLGASFQRGLREARFQYVMLLCGDGGLPAASLPAIFERVGSADLVLPFMTNLRRIKTPLRYVISRTYTHLLNLLFGFSLQYYNGLPVYRRSLLRAIQITSDGFGFQGEIVVKLLKSGCTYIEVGVEGAEETRRSVALKLKNIMSVARTLFHLVWEIARFRPVPTEVVERSRLSEEFRDESTRSS
jgi:dolichol-phosphate mannosyltransferase